MKKKLIICLSILIVVIGIVIYFVKCEYVEIEYEGNAIFRCIDFRVELDD